MSLNESIVEDAALDWFGELHYTVDHGVAFAELLRVKSHRSLDKPEREN
jgi:hypothetical protein